MAITRRQSRIQTFMLLFARGFYLEEERGAQNDLFFQFESDEEEGMPLAPCLVPAEEREYIIRRVEGIEAVQNELDERLNEAARGWSTSRMPRADLAILRLALYEMTYDESIPVGVAINEAVELAKLYGSDASPAFINGILAGLVKES